MEKFYRLWFVSFVIKLALAAALPFFSDEAYYWVWSHNLQLSYFDHPPAVAWLFWFGHVFENFGQASRWIAVVLGHSTIFIWHAILSRFLDQDKMKWWWWLVLLNPLLGPGSLVITPDVPLMFFWSASLWALLKLLDQPSWKWFSVLGVFLGLGFCSKYHIVLFVPFALWAFKDKLKILKNPSFLLTILMGFLFSSPVWLWNLMNDWESFRYQLGHGLGGGAWKAEWTLSYLGGQVALIFPTILFVILRDYRKNQIPSWLAVFAWGPLAVFFLTSFKGRVEANWPMVAYPAVMAIAASAAPSWPRTIKSTLAIWGAGLVAVISLVFFHWAPIDPSKTKTSEHRTYDVLVPVAASYQPFFASSYQMASTLTYRLKKPIAKLRGIGRRDFYDMIPESLPSSDNFFVALDQWDKLPDTVKDFELTQTIQINDRFRLVELKRK